MLILGIETSCDETAVALLAGDGSIRANLISSQIVRHRPFGGVVPEIASREHLEHFMPLLSEALAAGGASLREVSAIAVTAGPGLIGALLVGVAAAQGLSYGAGIPLIAVNHLEGHVFSPYLAAEGAGLPLPSRFLALVISGGHSSIYDVRRGPPMRLWMLNRTRDDAAGEVFDKVAKAIGLPYPGGPQIERLALGGDEGRCQFPISQFREASDDFSFSGLKSMAIRKARELGLLASSENGADPSPLLLSDFCASFQRAVGDQILDRLTRVWNRIGKEADAPRELAVAGGVAANSALRARLTDWCAERDMVARLPERVFCTDNAAMIAFAGLQRFMAGESSDPLRVKARSRWPMGSEEANQKPERQT